MARLWCGLADPAEAAGAGVGGPSRLLARTTCERQRILYKGCCLDRATSLGNKEIIVRYKNLE